VVYWSQNELTSWSSPWFLQIALNSWDWCKGETSKIMFKTQALVPGKPIKLNWFRFWMNAAETSQIVLKTVDFGSPTVSPITWRKLPEAKKRNATRTWTVGDKAIGSAKFVIQDLCVEVSPKIESRPKRKRIWSSSSEKFVKSMSCILCFFSWCGNAKRSNNESAILFVLKHFNPKVS